MRTSYNPILGKRSFRVSAIITYDIQSERRDEFSLGVFVAFSYSALLTEKSPWINIAEYCG